MIIDATDLIVGRVGTFAAKKALLGERVDIVNCEKAVVTGNRNQVLQRFKQKSDMGGPHAGPFIHRGPDRLMRRMIKNMLPHKKTRGKEAFDRIMCWKGVPEQFKDQKMEIVEGAGVSKLPTLKYQTLGYISKFLGGKVE